MISWSSKKQISYGGAFLLTLLVLIGTPLYFTLKKEPTCFDNILNQNEQGTDCGGVCYKACLNQVVKQPIISWARSFRVTNGYYNLAAYIQNPNVDHISKRVEYRFKVYDEENVILGIREGSTTISPNKNILIFEPGFKTDQRKPARVYFEFVNGVEWTKYDQKIPEFKVLDIELKDATDTPKVLAGVQNQTINTFRNLEVSVVVYDDRGNARLVSRTLIDSIFDRETREVLFTWPGAIDFEVSKIEIIPKLPVN